MWGSKLGVPSSVKIASFTRLRGGMLAVVHVLKRRHALQTIVRGELHVVGVTWRGGTREPSIGGMPTLALCAIVAAECISPRPVWVMHTLRRARGP